MRHLLAQLWSGPIPMACRDKGRSPRLAGHVLLLKLPFSSRGLRMHHYLPAALSTKLLRRLLLCFFVGLFYIVCCSHFAEFCSLFPRVIKQCDHIFDLSLQNTLEGKWPVAQEPARIINHSSIPVCFHIFFSLAKPFEHFLSSYQVFRSLPDRLFPLHQLARPQNALLFHGKKDVPNQACPVW